MELWWWQLRRAFVVAAVVVVITREGCVRGEDVTYDGRSLIIDGERRLLFSGSIHYPRSTPEMWGSLIGKAKEGGLDVIQTYVFWNRHEPQPGQIENEYQNVEAAFHEKGPSYVLWAAKMAVDLQTGAPWVMCKQTDAPDPVINTCNGMKCGQTFGGPNSPNKPTMWTENWTSFYQVYGGEPYIRSAEDIAFHVALFIARNGSYINYYMAYVFSEESAGRCVAFLINNDEKSNATVQFRNASHELLPKSIAILSDCEKEIFNTARVNTKQNKRIIRSTKKFDAMDKWQKFTDVIPNFENTSLQSDTLLEHMNVTKDVSDYLWYTLRKWLWQSLYEAIRHGETNWFKQRHKQYFFAKRNGWTSVSLLSTQQAFFFSAIAKDSGAFLETRFAGLRRVEIQCSKKELYNFTNYDWGYQVGLLGEKMQIYKEENIDNVEWSDVGGSSNQPLTWYKTVFEPPVGNDAVILNLSSMGKGEAWVNDQSIGRYWVSFLTSKGKPSQTMYHVPRSFLKNSGNLLVLLEEYGGNPLHISLSTISLSTTYEPISHNELRYNNY
ncbi:hypothetical protein C1H46_012737 [Malus baccata]|uniref:beta-galactosidase n=1 Tax=Malus baccata TaxID=106549 RepID=A0A540MTX0_MALBA|nr:hypothetical protein C1H46_012737 [Malus baccata]